MMFHNIQKIISIESVELVGRIQKVKLSLFVNQKKFLLLNRLKNFWAILCQGNFSTSFPTETNFQHLPLLPLLFPVSGIVDLENKFRSAQEKDDKQLKLLGCTSQ